MKHNFLRRTGALLLALALALPMVFTTAWAADDDGPVQAAQITLSETSLTLTPNQVVQLTCTVWPEDAEDKSVTWSSSDTKSATVDQNGWVTAIAPSSQPFRIIVRSVSNPAVQASCMVNVIDPETPTVKLNVESLSLIAGETFPLTATVTPAGRTVTWSSSNRNFVTVDQNGMIAAVRQTTAPITITATVKGANGKTATATCTVTVRNAAGLAATSLTPRGSTTVSLTAGERAYLNVNVVPTTADVTWTSSDPRVVSVGIPDASGTPITGVSTGEATVTASARKADGTELTVEYKVTVKASVTGIRFTASNVDVTGSGNYARFDGSDSRTKTVSVAMEAGGDTNAYIVWTSSDTSIVTATPNRTNSCYADLSIPAARKAGTAVITATVYDLTTQKPIMVSEDKPLCDELNVTVSGIALSETSLTMHEGEGRTLTVLGYGDAAAESAATVEWRSGDTSIASAEIGGSVSAWSKGTTYITAVTRGSQQYTATCTVTVTEDPGSVVNAGSASAGIPLKLGTSSVISQLNSSALQRTGSAMDYITSIFVSPDQGVVYNTYTSEADTGAGVSMMERYYVNRTTPASECVGALSFVANKSFSGEARISFIGYSGGQPVSGTITVTVTGMGGGSSDVTYTANAAPVTFQAEDFNLISISKTGRSLKYVTFTPPDASRGTLYEGYVNAAHPGQKVVATTRYNRTGTPSVNNVTFVPADGYSGTVTISYRAVDSANVAYTGRVTITVTPAASASDPADIYYTVPQDGWVTFRAMDFATASLRTIGETLSHVRFALPPSSDGTLFYNYRGFGNYDSDVASTTSYYQAGNPALGGVTFVPATTSTGHSVITYTGYSIRGTTFTGKIYVTEGTGIYQPGQVGGNTGSNVLYTYTVNSGSSVSLNANDLNNACMTATGTNLSYIRFTSLPTTSQGTLRYRTGSSTYYNSVTTATSFYRVGIGSSTPLISGISFLANGSYTGVVRIPYVGYSVNNISFVGEITIQVNPNTIVYTGTAANPLRLSASRIRTAVGDTFSRELSYIEFTSLPSISAGRIYAGYSGYGTGAQVNTGVRYYASSTPSIDQLSFVPTARYTGDAVASYTAYSTSGERMTGTITFRISAASGSSYFNDMYNYAWAAPSVDYLYQNGVTTGITATTFGPSQQILRRDFVLMLYRTFKFTAGSAANPGFADVPANSYYAQAVSGARQLGIISGDGRNFMPSSPVTRQDAMVMIVNAMKVAGKLQSTASTTVLNRFPDASSVSGYAREAVSTLVQMGAVSGSNGMLNPRSAITRAEAAVILHFVMTA